MMSRVIQSRVAVLHRMLLLPSRVRRRMMVMVRVRATHLVMLLAAFVAVTFV
jgi:hypothetical protein